MAVGPLGEGLFASTTIRMFGRLFDGLTVNDLGLDEAAKAPISLALDATKADPAKTVKLARIYGFSYKGNYTKMSVPSVFLVFSDGTEVPPGLEQELGLVGMEYKLGSFSGGLKMFNASELDVGVRIDISVGWMSDILLSQELGPDGGSDLVGRDGNLVGRDGNLVGRDGNLIGPARRRS